MDLMKDLLKKTIKLPSLPSVAVRIVEIANKPDVSIADLSKILSMDPALASKVLRFANSAAYGMTQKIETLNRAVVVMGLDAIVNISLSFTLVNSMRSQEGEGLDYTLFWRRSLVAAAAARVIGEESGEKELEELFLAGLLQDIGMLALDRIEPEFYNGLGEAQIRHAEVQAYERALFGQDHTYIGKWLMGQWGLHPRTIKAGELSHLIKPLNPSEKYASFVHCIVLSGQVADLFLSEESKKGYIAVAKTAQRLLKLDEKQMIAVLERTGKLVKSVEKLFDMKFIEEVSAVDIMSSANEALMMRNVDLVQHSEGRQGLASEAPEADSETAETDTGSAESVEEKKTDKWQDALTEIPNRDFLDHYLTQLFGREDVAEKQLCLAVVDLDRFRQVNNEQGRPIGDLILKASVRLLRECLDKGQVLTRFGGGEFALLMPGADLEQAEKTCDRVVDRFAEKAFPLKGGERLTVTVSVGLVCHGGKQHFDNAEDMLRAAQFSVSSAKLQGRNRLMVYDKLQ